MSSTLSSSSPSSFTAGLREEGQPNRQQVLEPVHQQPHGVDGGPAAQEEGAAAASGPARAQLCHSGLGARSARLLQRHRPQMRSDSSEVMARIGLS